MADTGTFPGGEGRSLLVVEGDEANAELLDILLRMAGYRVRLARSLADGARGSVPKTDGRKAVERIQRMNACLAA